MTQRLPQPALDLYDYQRRWIGDTSRYKIGLWCRQSGKSFATALEAVLDVVQSGRMWVLLSAGERQSKELMEKVRMHLQAMQIAGAAMNEDFFADTSCRQLSADLPNRGRIVALPANPLTARGFSANVLLDEFAFHRDSRQIWTALFPTISRGFKLRVVSTPQGKSNQFYQLYTGDNEFEKHKTDIYQAVQQGLDVDIDQLRRGIDDADAWAQEYECQFLDEATAFLTYDLIAACEADDCLGPAGDGPVYVGIDIGRKRDLTVVWVVEQVGDVFWTRQVRCLEKTPFPQQIDFIGGLLSTLRPVRTCVDGTGMGGPIAEQLQRQFGTAAVENVTFSNVVKQDLATRTRRLFEEHRVRLPVDNVVRQDLHSVKKTVTAAGNIRFDAERTADGHADRFWALALALMATDCGLDKPKLYWLESV